MIKTIYLLFDNRNIISKMLAAILLLLPLSEMEAQVTIGMDSKPSSAALLDLKTIDNTTGGITTKKGGLLLPRVALDRLNSLEPFITNGGSTADKLANKGLLVYNLSNNSIFQPGIYVWNGSTWIAYVQGVEKSATNGLSFSDNGFFLGGELTQNTSITGTNTLTLGVPTTVSNNLTVSGNETQRGDLSVAGLTSLNSTKISVNGTSSLVIDDGKTSKVGKYLKAMDDAGRAEWQALGAVATTPPVSFGSGITYDPTNTIGKKTNTTITLPPGKWLVQCAFLFIVQTVTPVNSATSNTFYSHWVQVRMYNSATGYLATNSLVSGNVNKTSKYNMLTGYFVVTNSTSQDIAYDFRLTASSSEGYLWPASSLIECFNGNNGENTVIAFSLTQ